MSKRLIAVTALALSACATSDDYTLVPQHPSPEAQPAWTVPDSNILTMKQCVRDGATRLARHNYELSWVLEVSEDGQVQAVRSEGADLDDAGVQTCLEQALVGVLVPSYVLQGSSDDLVSIRTSPEARRHMSIAWAVPLVKLMPIVINSAGITILIGMGLHVIAMAGTWVGAELDKKRKCSEEWQRARNRCYEMLESPDPPRGVTGGYMDPLECAKGLVSQECGGNFIDHGKAK